MIAAAATAVVAAACDIEDTQHEQGVDGPPLLVIGSNVEGNAAVIPADGVIQLAFDRYLLPATSTRQSFVIVDANRAPLPPQELKTIYDPVARTITIAGPNGPGTPWLTPDQTYRLILPVAPDPSTNVGGFRAIDRTPLLAEREFLFRAGPPTGEKRIPGEPAVDFCADVFPLFHERCNGGACHGGSTPAAGLLLATSEGVRVSARDRIAQGSNTSGRAVASEETDRLFGIDMPIIKRGDPGSSWLVYKLELAAPRTVDATVNGDYFCTPPEGGAPVPERAAAFSSTIPFRIAAEHERSILRDYVLGREMPYPYPPQNVVDPATGLASGALLPLSFAERERIRLWIAAGAEIRECGGCGSITTETDGGAAASDAGTSAPVDGSSDAPSDAADAADG